MLSFRSTSLVGIGKRGCSDQVGGVGDLVAGDKTFTDAGVHRAVGGAGLVCESGKLRLYKVFPETLARVPGDDFIAQIRRKAIEPSSEHIETDARIEQSQF